MKSFVLFVFILSGILGSCNNETIESTSDIIPKMDGSWQLTYISGPRIAFDGLYPDKKPMLVIDQGEGRYTGHTGCNSISGKMNVIGNSISFEVPVATRMACPGVGEELFLQTLKKINAYTMSSDSTLTLVVRDVAFIRMARIPSP